MDKDELIKLWKSSASGFGCGNFSNSSELRDRVLFHNLARVYLENWPDLHENFITGAPLDKEVTI